MGLFSETWRSLSKTRGLIDLYDMACEDIADDVLLAAAQEIAKTSKRIPVPADLREVASKLRAEAAIARAKREDAEREASYITYWDRSPEERAAIDEARNECMRFVRSLSPDGDVAAWEAIARESIRR